MDSLYNTFGGLHNAALLFRASFLQLRRKGPVEPSTPCCLGWGAASGVAEPANDPMDDYLIRLPRDENWQRRYPRDETMNPLLLSFAHLLESGTMSVLQTAHIVARRGVKAKPWVVCYCAPGSTSRYVQFSKVDIDRPRVWLVTEQWEPSSEVMNVFRQAGRAIHHQDAAVIKWKNPYTPFEGFRMR